MNRSWRLARGRWTLQSLAVGILAQKEGRALSILPPVDVWPLEPAYQEPVDQLTSVGPNLLLLPYANTFCNYEYPPLGGGGGVVMAALAQAARTAARSDRADVARRRLAAARVDEACTSARSGIFSPRARRCKFSIHARVSAERFPARHEADCAIAVRCDQHAFRRADRTARSCAGALARHSECAVSAWRRSVRSEQRQLAASACAAARGRALAAAMPLMRSSANRATPCAMSAASMASGEPSA